MNSEDFMRFVMKSMFEFLKKLTGVIYPDYFEDRNEIWIGYGTADYKITIEKIERY